jgi:formate dehydrogenase assembly factor FdhD
VIALCQWTLSSTLQDACSRDNAFTTSDDVFGRCAQRARRVRTTDIAGEHPLTVYVDKREIVTLMTLGAAPEALAIGYLRNQRLVGSIDDIALRCRWIGK